MSMQLVWVRRTVRNGLETFEVLYGNTVLSHHVSAELALTKKRLLERELHRGLK